MATATELLREAKELFNYGAFTPLRQAEFFRAMEEALGEVLDRPPPQIEPELVPLVARLPEATANLNVSEQSDRKG